MLQTARVLWKQLLQGKVFVTLGNILVHLWLTWSIHFIMQCIWKQWVQAPQTTGQSSPGVLHSGQQPSKAIRQMPHVSSLAIQRLKYYDEDYFSDQSNKMCGLWNIWCHFEPLSNSSGVYLWVHQKTIVLTPANSMDVSIIQSFSHYRGSLIELVRLPSFIYLS